MPFKKLSLCRTRALSCADKLSHRRGVEAPPYFLDRTKQITLPLTVEKLRVTRQLPSEQRQMHCPQTLPFSGSAPSGSVLPHLDKREGTAKVHACFRPNAPQVLHP